MGIAYWIVEVVATSGRQEVDKTNETGRPQLRVRDLNGCEIKSQTQRRMREDGASRKGKIEEWEWVWLVDVEI